MRVILFTTDLALTHPTRSSDTEVLPTTRPGVRRPGSPNLSAAGADLFDSDSELASADRLNARESDSEDVPVAGPRCIRGAETEILFTVGPGLAPTSPYESSTARASVSRQECTRVSTRTRPQQHRTVTLHGRCNQAEHRRMSSITGRATTWLVRKVIRIDNKVTQLIGVARRLSKTS